MRKYPILVLVLLLLLVVVGCKAEKINSDSNQKDSNSSSQEVRKISKDINLIKEFDKFKAKINGMKNNKKQEKLIDKMIDLIGEDNFPLIQGNNIILIYRTQNKQDEIYLTGDINKWNKSKMIQLADTSLYYLKLKVPKQARFDYKFIVNGEFKNDPFNSHQVPSNVFKSNSQVQMPQYTTKGYWQKDKEVQGGTLVTEVIGDNKLSIYLPHGYQKNKKQRYSVLYFIAGDQYLKHGGIINTLDNLIALNKIRPVIAVFINDNKSLGQIEYNQLIIQDIIPYLDNNYHTSATSKGRIMIGFAQGANIAAEISFNHPALIGNLISQSGFYSDQILNLVDNNSNQEFKLYLDWGKFSYQQYSLINLELVRKLKKKDYKYQFQIHYDGPQWANWRENISDALEYILGDKEIIGSNKIKIKEDFSGEVPKYLPIGDNKQLLAKENQGRYQLQFKESNFIKINHYRFQNFDLRIDLNFINEKSFGFSLAGKKAYTILINPKDKKLYSFSDAEEKIYQNDFSSLNKIESCRLKVEDNYLIIYLNNQLLNKIKFSTENSKYISLLGTKGAQVSIDSITLMEELK